MNALISARILALTTAGLTLPESIDAVLGAGSFEKMAGEVYAALRSE